MSKILLIEDDPTMIRLLRTLLEIEGFTVEEVHRPDSQQALAAIHQFNPDSVLVDVHLRRANGLDILHAIRQDPALQDLSVVMTSGMDLTEQCLQAGANAFLVKPFMPEALLAALRGSPPA